MTDDYNIDPDEIEPTIDDLEEMIASFVPRDQEIDDDRFRTVLQAALDHHPDRNQFVEFLRFDPGHFEVIPHPDDGYFELLVVEGYDENDRRLKMGDIHLGLVLRPPQG